MSKLNQKKRDFKGSDTSLLTRCGTWQQNFVEDKAVFTAAFPDLNDPYAGNWLLAIEAAEASPEYAARVANQTVATEAVDQKMVVCKAALKELYVYVPLAWPKSPTRLNNAFGKARYSKATKNGAAMARLLADAFAEANKTANKALLNTKGYGNGKVAALNTLAGELSELVSTADALRSQVPVATEDHIELMNAAYGFMIPVADAATVVFSSDPAKLAQYTLNPGGSVTTVVSLLPGETKTVMERVSNRTRIRFANSSPGPLMLCRRSLPAEPCTMGPATTVQPGMLVDMKASELAPGGGNLNLTNTGTTEAVISIRRGG